MALTNLVVKTRPTITTFGFGRAWFAGVVHEKYASTIFYSQVMNDVSNVNRCYQDADPTAEEINSLIDSDGGTIEIPETATHVKLHFLGNVILLLCSNGVWAILPGPDGFKPDAFSVRKISSDGCISRDSVVEVEGLLLYATSSGINQISYSRENGGWVAQSITENTIERRYTNITRDSLKTLRGVYDRRVKRVHFFTQNANGVINSAINLSLKGNAWYPWKFDEDTYLKGRVPFVSPEKSGGSSLYVMATNEGVPAKSDTFVCCQFNDRKFKDYGANNFESYMVTAPLTLDNPQAVKSTKYIYTYLEKTETGYVDNAGSLEYNFPSEVNLSTQWDWHTSANSGRWSEPQQVYKFDRGYAPVDVNDTFDTGDRVIVNRARLMGEGRALSLKFESSDNKDMRLIGYTLPMFLRGQD